MTFLEKKNINKVAKFEFVGELETNQFFAIKFHPHPPHKTKNKIRYFSRLGQCNKATISENAQRVFRLKTGAFFCSWNEMEELKTKKNISLVILFLGGTVGDSGKSKSITLNSIDLDIFSERVSIPFFSETFFRWVSINNKNKK